MSIKLNATNYLVWRSQILPLIESLKVFTNLCKEPPTENCISEKGEVAQNSKFKLWKEQDVLLDNGHSHRIGPVSVCWMQTGQKCLGLLGGKLSSSN